MNEADLQERQALIDDIINHLTGGITTDMHITVDLDAEIIHVAPMELSDVEIDFAYTIDCTGTCRMTFSLAMRRSDYELWRSDTVVVQECLPYIMAPFRELLVTGLCPACWREMLGTPDVNEESEAAQTQEKQPQNSATAPDAAERAAQPATLHQVIQQPLDRIIFLLKDERIGLLRITQDRSGIRVISYDQRRPQPSVRVYGNTEQECRTALSEFRKALKVSVNRGWRIGYSGAPLFG